MSALHPRMVELMDEHQRRHRMSVRELVGLLEAHGYSATMLATGNRSTRRKPRQRPDRQSLHVTTLKKIVLATAAASGGFSFFRWLTRHEARILAYHGVDDRHEPLLNLDGLHVHPEIFESHLRTLRGHYKIVTLRSLVECFRDGKTPPSRAVAVTFDDGYANNFTIAARLLGEFCMPATFFYYNRLRGRHAPPMVVRASRCDQTFVMFRNSPCNFLTAKELFRFISWNSECSPSSHWSVISNRGRRWIARLGCATFMPRCASCPRSRRIK